MTDVHPPPTGSSTPAGERAVIGTVRAVERALDILQAFTSQDDGLTAAQLLQRVALSRPTLYRLLHTLQHKGFVSCSGEPAHFRLGPAAARLAHAWHAGADLVRLAEPFMRRLWRDTGETVALFAAEPTTRVCVAEMPSPQALSYRRGVGYRERLLLGASGRCILAQIESSVDWTACASGLDIDQDLCRRELAQIRRSGYAVSRDALIPGAVALAAPVFDGSGRVAGSLAVFGPSARLPLQRVDALGPSVVAEAAALSNALGASPRQAPQVGAV